MATVRQAAVAGRFYPDDPRKLRDLVLEHLDRKIQEGEHGSVEDATAAMDLYKLFAADWEASLRSQA